MKLLECTEQSEQPMSDSEDELVEFDVKYLLDCLAKERCASYQIIGRPDITERHSPQPDYLAEETQSRALLAIEHGQLFKSEATRETEAIVVKRSGILLKWLKPPSTKELEKRLSEFVDKKLAKGQFADYNHAERILLARNRWSDARIDHFIKAKPRFDLWHQAKCDHFYIIVSSRLIQAF